MSAVTMEIKRVVLLFLLVFYVVYLSVFALVLVMEHGWVAIGSFGLVSISAVLFFFFVIRKIDVFFERLNGRYDYLRELPKIVIGLSFLNIISCFYRLHCFGKTYFSHDAEAMCTEISRSAFEVVYSVVIIQMIFWSLRKRSGE